MRPQKKLLSELSNKTDQYSVRVKVIDKSRPITSPSKTKYQKLVLEDEQGNIMRATLFNEDVEAYEDVILNRKEYEITNAPIKSVNPNYAIGDEKFQMGFNHKTVVRQLNMEGSSSTEPEVRNYLDIASVDRAATIYDRFDILGVVVFVSVLKDNPNGRDNSSKVREIVITDHSSSQPLVISAWDDLALAECDMLEEKIADYPVVGFTALRPAKFKGFSLCTTPSTYILTDPKGEKADELKKWAKENVIMLSQRHGLISRSRTRPEETQITTIKDLKEKKVATTFQEERCWIEGKIVDHEHKNIHFYLGCSKCSKRSQFELGEVYNCRLCRTEGCKSTHKMSYAFELSDGTGSLNLTAFSGDAESILGIGAEKLVSLKPSDLAVFNTQLAKRMDKKPFKVLVGPDNSININRALKWVLKEISATE